MKLEYVVEEKDNNMMVKDIVKKRLNVSSRLYKKIVQDIRLNGEKCYTTNRVNLNDRITVDLDNAYDFDTIYNKFKPWNHNLDIIYEDEYILCINKESGIPCHPSVAHQENTLYNAIINYYVSKNKKVPIHFINRLDRDTTGVVIVAKHKYVQEMLISQMKNGEFNKKYIAVVYGKMENKEGIIERNIRRKEGTIILREVTDGEDGEYAKTGYKVIGYNEKENYSILEVSLYTGRTHQIRVHFSSIGHPLLGDELYTKESNIKIKEIYKYINRQALHAYQVQFKYVNDSKFSIKAEIPDDIKKYLTGKKQKNILIKLTKFT